MQYNNTWSILKKEIQVSAFDNKQYDKKVSEYYTVSLT